MSINTINRNSKHAESIIEKLRSTNDLPFKDILSSDAIEKHLSPIEHRERIFTPEMTLFALLSQVISSDQSCQAAVAQVVARLASEEDIVSMNTAAYCKARARLPEEVLSGLTRESAVQMEQEVPEKWLWRGRHVDLVDGSCISMPDTEDNQLVYPQPNTQKKALDFLLHA